jgi:hypothetical protein
MWFSSPGAQDIPCKLQVKISSYSQTRNKSGNAGSMEICGLPIRDNGKEIVLFTAKQDTE